MLHNCSVTIYLVDGDDWSIWNGAGQNDFTIFSIVPFELIKDDRTDNVANVSEEVLVKEDVDSYFVAMQGLIALSDGVIIEVKTARKDDCSIIHVIVSDAWYNSEEYQKERFAESVAEVIESISSESGVSNSVSVYFYDANDKRLAEPKLFGGHKILN